MISNLFDESGIHNAFEVFETFQALKLHFTTTSYDFFKYGGKTRFKEESFLRRKDKNFYYRLSRKLRGINEVEFVVSNLIENESLWIKDLLDVSAMNVYNEWKKRNESLSYVFNNDLTKLTEEKSLRECFAVIDGEYPIALVKLMHGELCIETLVIINKLTHFLESWDKKITDDLIYPKLSLKVKKYTNFVNFDEDKIKKIVKEHL